MNNKTEQLLNFLLGEGKWPYGQGYEEVEMPEFLNYKEQRKINEEVAMELRCK